MMISKTVGKRIQAFRKARHMTLEDLSEKIFKSKSTISKYEKGEIALDIETLYDIAKALHVYLEQLLYTVEPPFKSKELPHVPAFFKDLSQFYGYLYDGRANRIIRCVFNIHGPTDINTQKVMMYMNFRDFDHYQDCENTYWGTMEHFDALTHISLTNQDTPMEKASLQILASYLDSPTKWGLFNGFSSRPMMPIAVKMIISKEIASEDETFLKSLKVSRADIRLLKLYNMLSVT
ncbi:helix-turn-helix domain-containing protein [Acidaminococcus sp.]|uniref:helix-turn-helix domain-containing protein n=1 Tax=Acidaminococcus sp. TaxID=1872103 RepID=UPI003AB7F2F8